VSTAASTVLNPDELLQQVVDLTKERFGLYHAQVYLADDAWNTLLLAAGAGDIGKQMVLSGNTIPMEKNELLVSRATHERKALISNDVRREESFQINPLLPDTRSEMAVPMIAGDKVLGVFDVHSVNLNHFSEEDANIYTTLASQVAVSLQNARLYAEQAETVAQLRELDRLKSSFLANMSHELRTPLNSILGFSDVMLEELDGPLTDNMRNDLGLIQKNGQHLLHLINDVLDMAKIESGKMNLNIEKFNLQEIIEEVTSITSPFASERNLSLFIEPDSDYEVRISADKIRIRQVMINLINNAIKFTERGKISIRAACEDNHVLISVKDTGIGIPHDHLEAVFQEFTQVDTSTTRKVGGTGLGLPISRRLIEMHGGRLWAESSGVNGEGSIFYVFLPIEARVKEEDESKVK
jgi:signal transduction histidine kinase